MSTIAISIIVPTCNRSCALQQCLERLLPQIEVLNTKVEILVCDDSRSEETRRMIHECFPSVQWHEGPKRGPAANRNLGAAKATGDWLIFLDDDCLPSNMFLSAYVEAISLISGQMVALEGPTIRSSEPLSLLWEAPHNPNGGSLISCNFAIRREEFHRVGRFDESYPVAAFEDTEFAARFLAAGGKIAFVQNALAEHPLRPVPNASKLASRWEGKTIISLDYGASPLHVLVRLPWHAFRVIQSRFRGKQISRDNIRAVFLFALEWILVCWQTPGWVRKHATRPRPEFWVRHFATHGPIAKYGL